MPFTSAQAEDERGLADGLDTDLIQVEQMKKAKAKKAGGPAKKDDAAAPASPKESKDPEPEPTVADETPTATAAQQSKARSTSFRQGSISIPHPGAVLGSAAGSVPQPFSPEGETAPDIYRKHVTRIEELERENKRLGKEAKEAEKRWEKAEEELADLREKEGDAGGKEEGKGVEGLVCRLSFLLCGGENAHVRTEKRNRRPPAPKRPATVPAPPRSRWRPPRLVPLGLHGLPRRLR